MTQTTTSYKNVGRSNVDLHDGRILEPGQTRELTSDEAALPHNQRLVALGTLVPAQTAAKVNATDEAIQLAADNGVDLAELQGSGAHGRITKGDVDRHLKQKESD